MDISNELVKKVIEKGLEEEKQENTLLKMNNKQLTELINQAQQIRKERLKQKKKEIIKDLQDIISRAENLGISFSKDSVYISPILYNTINILNSDDEVIYFDFHNKEF